MEFQNFFTGKKQQVPKERREECEIVTEQRGNKLVRKIRGNCSNNQLRALSNREPLDNESN